MKHELPATPVVIKTLHDVADRGQVFAATLPQEANSQLVYFKATVSDASDSSSLAGTIAPGEKGGYDLKITARNGPLPKDIKVVVSRLSWKWRKRSSVKIAERTYEKKNASTTLLRKRWRFYGAIF